MFERNLNGLQKERRNLLNSDDEDLYGQTVLINGEEFKPNIPARQNPMDNEKFNTERQTTEDGGSQPIMKRNFDVLEFEERLWANNRIPYVIKEDTFGTNLAKAKSLIQAAIKEIQESSCVQWVPRKDERFYVKFEGKEYEGCSATVGFYAFGNGQSINIAKGCLEIESVLHEMYHTMGANHEIQRLHRSDYLTVLWDNIHYSKYPQYSVRKGTRDRYPYDYHSVMHYRLSTFPLFPGQNTIKLRDPELNYLVTIPKKGLSFLDVAEINDAYQCTESCTIQCQNGGFPIKPLSGICKCKCPSGLKGDYCEQVEKSASCGEILNLKTDVETYVRIQNYDQSSDCTWVFKGAPGTRIRIILFHLNLPQDQNNVCQHWLEFRDYHIGTPGKKFCGQLGLNDNNKYIVKDYVAGDPTMMMVRLVPKTKMSSTYNYLFKMAISALPSGCYSNPCQHGGSCHEGYSDGTHTCSCINGFSGDNCERFPDNGYNSCDFSKELSSCVFNQELLTSEFYWTFTTRICHDYYCKTAIYTEQSKGNQFLTVNPDYGAARKLYDKKSYLVTDVYFSEKKRCLTFDYNMGNNPSGSYQTMVTIYSEEEVKTKLEKKSLWELKETTNYTWKKAKIDIHAKKRLKITIEAVMGPQELGIENMSLRPGLCSETVCNPNPCQNGGTCKISGNTYTCACTNGFTGTNCEQISACEPNPCKYGGICTRVGTTTSAECKCREGYTGNHCEVQNNPCGSKPCKNGGTCVSAQYKEPFPYKCVCPEEFFGDNCEGVGCSFEAEKWCSLVYGQQQYPGIWKRIKGPTPSPSTGPMKAAEGQYYLYMETSNMENETAALLHLRDDVAFESGTYCLSFQYSLIGKDIDRFVVVLYDSGFWNYRFQLERNGPQLGGEWLTFQETVTIYTYTYILIQGTKGNGFRSDFAVDNIRLIPGVCPY
uniref:Metalloendopeptidase n=1 Tax=Crassostrea virginica TaxID=6565 RepID=A0A8B8C2X3_CRAVI|nr:uncharacterized protein LOC111115062 [Crassostrea virginica]